MLWAQYVVYGLGIGAVFALLAAGLVLVYRATGVLNLAHASIGMVAGFVDFTLLDRLPWMPVGGALVLAVLFGAALGLAADRLVFRRVAEASPVVKLLTSFGLAGVLQGGVGLVWSHLGTPTTTGHTLLPMQRGVHVAGAAVPYQRLAIAVLCVLATVGLAALVRWTGFGIRLRALAQNPLAARLAGVDDRRVRAATWALAGATAALAAVLVMPFGPMNPLALSGYEVQALAAGLVGGLVSLPAVLAGALGLGVAEQLLEGAGGTLATLGTPLGTVLVLVLLLLRVERFFVSEQEARAVQGDERLFARAARVPALGPPRLWLAGAVTLAVLTVPMTGFWAFVTTRTALYALLGLSLVVLTGFSGQVSLMPGTFAGVGACLAWVFGTRLGYDPLVAVPLAALATIPVCAAVGLVAVRLRPLYLAVATLALAQTFDDTLFKSGWLANGGQRMLVARPSWLAGDRAYAVAVVLAVGALFAFTVAVARSRTGRALRMVRDNPRAAEAAGVNPAKYRLLAFALSAFYAGAAGAMLAYLLGAFTTELFSFLVLSLTAFGLATVGGIRSPLGSVVGAFLLVYVVQVVPPSPAVLDWVAVAVGAGIVVVMGWSQDGVVGLLQRLRPDRRPASVPDADEPVPLVAGGARA